MHNRIVIVGSGVIGSSIAWHAVEAGFDVTVVDPSPTTGASWVAGGMLAPVTEAWPGEERLLALGSESLLRWPDFAVRLRKASGSDPGLHSGGTVAVAVDSADRDELDMLARFLADLGRDVHRLGGKELRRLEPALGPSSRAGLWVPGDLAIDNRALLKALWCVAPSPVRQRVRAVRSGAVERDDGSALACDVVVIAAGAWSADLHPSLHGRIRPVKGEILRLGARASAIPPPQHTIRAAIEGRRVYLVPRHDGVVVGATQYEAGFDTDVTVAGVRDLLRDAERVVPGVADYAVVECAAGLRPSSVDNLPVIEWLEPGVIAATGHGRNGILLAPITAELVLSLLSGGL